NSLRGIEARRTASKPRLGAFSSVDVAVTDAPMQPKAKRAGRCQHASPKSTQPSESGNFPAPPRQGDQTATGDDQTRETRSNDRARHRTAGVDRTGIPGCQVPYVSDKDIPVAIRRSQVRNRRVGHMEYDVVGKRGRQAATAGRTDDAEAEIACTVAVKGSSIRHQSLSRDGLIDGDVAHHNAGRIELESLVVGRPSLRECKRAVQMHGDVHGRPVLHDVHGPQCGPGGPATACTMVRCQIEQERVRRRAGTGDTGDECRDCENGFPRERHLPPPIHLRNLPPTASIPEYQRSVKRHYLDLFWIKNADSPQRKLTIYLFFQ